MTLLLDPVVNVPSPIVCACVVDEQIVLVRKDGSVDGRKIPQVDEIIAACCVGRDKFALLNSRHDVSVHHFGGENDLVLHLPASELSRPVGVSFEKISTNFFNLANSDIFVFRSDWEERDMSADCRCHRRFIPVTTVSLSNERESISQLEGTHICACDFAGTIAILVRENADLFSVSILGSAVELIVPDKLGTGVNCITAKGSTLIVASALGIAFYENLKFKHLVMLPDSASIVPLLEPPIERKSPFPKLHPLLNLFKKYSEVQTAPLLVENLMNLSLGGRSPSVSNKRTSHLVVVSRSDPFPLPHAWKDSEFFVVANSALHAIDLKLAAPKITQSTPLRGEQDLLLSAGRKLFLVSGAECVESGELQDEKIAEPILSLASLESTVALHANHISFCFRNSVECHLIHEFPHLPPILSLSPVKEDHFAVSFFGETRLFRSLDFTQVFASPYLRSDTESIAVVELRGVLYQICANTVYVNGDIFLTRTDSCENRIIDFCVHENALHVLFTDGVTMQSDNRRTDTGIVDSTCFTIAQDGALFIGDFDGNVHSDAIITKISPSAIACMHAVDRDRILLSTRSDGIFVCMQNNFQVLHRIDSECVKMTRAGQKFICYGYNIFCLDASSRESPPSISSIKLGHTGSIDSVCVHPEDTRDILLSVDGKLTRIRLDTAADRHSAMYQQSLPFIASQMQLLKDDSDPRFATIYVIGSLKNSTQSALFVIDLDQTRVGLTGMKEALSISHVFPFKDETPIAICLWSHEMFPGTGLVAVGTRGEKNGKGRLILFDRSSMHAIAKTSLPSACVFSLCPLTSEILVVGCEDCAAFLSLRPGPSSMPGLLTTAAVYNTYSSVNFLTPIDSRRVLIVTENGVLQLVRFSQKDSNCSCEATPETITRIVSSCFLIPKSNRFVCSSADGDLLEYSIEPDCLKLRSTSRIGSRITSACPAGDNLTLGLENGSIFNLSNSPDKVRLVPQTS